MKCKNYDAKIKIHYQNNFDNEFVEQIIKTIWFDDDVVGNFKLVKGDDFKSQVFRCKYKGEVYYVKSQAPRETSKLIKNIFRPVEALRHFKMLQQLSNADLIVPKPILSLTYSRKLFVKDSILVTKELKGIDLDKYLLDSKDENYKLRKKIIEQIAEIWAKLINNKLLHQDPCLENFKVEFQADKIKVKLVDIDNIYHLPIFPKKSLLNNLAKLRARQLSDFIKTNTKDLNSGELNLFYETFLNAYDGDLKLNQVKERVNDLTIKRLLKYNSKDIVLNNESLSKIYNNKYI
ncbi:MAG: lipopolysaccharide kinase InaA family protein [Bacillota bacterium]